MENTTKALILAAAVLIAIILISVGIRLLTSTKKLSEEVEDVSSSTEVEIFNSQFNAYIGNSMSGSQIISLLKKIIISNNKFVNHTVAVHVGAISKSDYGRQEYQPQDIHILIDNNAFDSKTKYKLTVKEYSQGYISKLYIDEI